MTLAFWLLSAVFLLVTIATGWLTSHVAGLRRYRLLNEWPVYYLLGQLVMLALSLLTGFVPVSLGQVVAFLCSAVLLIGILLFVRREGVPLLKAAAMAFASVAVAGLLFPDLLLMIQMTPLIEHDAWGAWFLHGKVLYCDGRLLPGFFVDPLYDWAMTDYPILIGSNAAWSAMFSGGWNLYSNKVFLLFNAAAFAYLFFVVLVDRGFKWWLALLITVVVFDRETYSYASGYADVHYQLPLVIALLATLRRDPAEYIPFAGIMLGYASNVKNESLVYVIVIVMLALLGALLRLVALAPKAVDGSNVKRKAGVLVPLLIGAVPVIMWLVFRMVHGISHPFSVVGKITEPAIIGGLLAERALPIATYFLDNYLFRGAPLLLGLLAILYFTRFLLARKKGGIKPFLDPFEIAGWGMFITFNVLIFVPYVLTPLKLSFHLGTSAGRLLFLPYLLLFVLCVLAAEKILALTRQDAGTCVESRD